MGGDFPFSSVEIMKPSSLPRYVAHRVALWIAFARGGGKIGGSKGAK